VKLAEPARAWLVSSESGPELALLQTARQPVVSSDGSKEAAQRAAQLLPIELPGIVGPSAVADAFSKEWRAHSSGNAHLHGEMIFYALDRVEAFRRPLGELRRATIDDFDALLPLAIAAAKDMNLPPVEQIPEEVEKRVRRNLAANRQFLWVEASSVQAIASYAESMEDAGARIGLVYTRPELRGRGYGSAITGSLAQLLLDEGQAWVSLFADAANPTSNGIYQRLGFKPELNYRTWLFG
jgi:hypothetical protein